VSEREEKRNRDRELKDRLDVIEAKVNDIRVLAAQLEGKKRVALDEKVEGVVGSIEELRKHAVGLESKVAQAFATLRQLVDASNASSTLLSCVEKLLDEKYGDDWDHGVRKEVEHRAELLRKRKALIDTSFGSKEMSDEVRDALASEIWDVATELDTRSDDIVSVLGLRLQSGDVNAALDVVEEVHKDGLKLAPDVAQMVQQLIDRARVVAKEQNAELLAARAERMRGIVGPDGNPIST
jgi:hypothetical protein